MYLKNYQAHNYRNIENCNITFEKGVNLLIGDNAQGKTNALESIYYFARGKSFRSASEDEICMFGKNYYSSQITFETTDRKQTLRYEYEDGKRKRYKNGIQLHKLTEMIGNFRAILFYPEHLQLIKGGPQERRDFLNIAIAQHDRIYIDYLSQYNKILENRNILLKDAQKGKYVDFRELEAWSEQLSHYASQIYIRRKKYIEEFSPFANEIMKDLSVGKEELNLSYIANTKEDNLEEIKKVYIKLFSENLKQECAAGFSLYGIHRDDLDIQIKGVSAKTYASQGQQRSAVLALKLAEGEYSKFLTKEYPVFLFDDVLSELDDSRKQYVLSNSDEKQIILTACDKHFLNKDFYEIVVSGGKYVSSYRER